MTLFIQVSAATLLCILQILLLPSFSTTVPAEDVVANMKRQQKQQNSHHYPRSEHPVMIAIEKARQNSSVIVEVKEAYHKRNVMNPSIIFLTQNVSILSVRSGRYNSKLHFYYHSFASSNSFDMKSAFTSIYQSFAVTDFIPSLFPPSLSEESMKTKNGETQEDARLFQTASQLKHHPTTFYILYSYGRMIDSTHEVFKQALCVANYQHPTRQIAVVGQPMALVQSQDEVLLSEKNWMPFEYQDELHFVTSINPLHIERLPQTPPITANRSSYNSSANNTIKLHRVITSPLIPADSLPWQAEYDNYHLKGSTNLVNIGNIYLGLFHTSPEIKQRRVYFTGIFAICATPPFHLHAMSSYPLTDDVFFDVSDLKRGLNKYVWSVAFPTTIQLDPDGLHLWLAMGRQDKHGAVVKLNIYQLLDSMKRIKSCRHDV